MSRVLLLLPLQVPAASLGESINFLPGTLVCSFCSVCAGSSVIPSLPNIRKGVDSRNFTVFLLELFTPCMQFIREADELGGVWFSLVHPNLFGQISPPYHEDQTMWLKSPRGDVAYSLAPNSAGNRSAVSICKPASYISQPAFTENLTPALLAPVERLPPGSVALAHAQTASGCLHF